MSMILVKTGAVTIPGMCVACAAPTSVPGKGPQRARRMLEASGSVRIGNTVTTDKISFPLCASCADTRQREIERQAHYPGRGWTLSAGWLAAALAVAWIVAVNHIPDSPLTYAAFWASVAAVVTAATLSKVLRGRNDRLNPPSDADRERLRVIRSAVTVQPVAGRTDLAGVTFGNERFAEAFAMLNPSAPGGMFFGQGGGSQLAHR
jgi:hypothetical protein